MFWQLAWRYGRQLRQFAVAQPGELVPLVPV